MSASEQIASQFAASNRNKQIWSAIFINPQDSPYNAKGDGVTDDTAAIQAALTAAGTNGSVIFPKKDFVISAQLTASCNIDAKQATFHTTGAVDSATSIVPGVFNVDTSKDVYLPTVIKGGVTTAASDYKVSNLTKQEILVVASGGDDTQQLKNAISRLTKGSTLYIKGKVIFTDNINFTNLTWITIKGDGSLTSQLYNNSTGKSIIFNNCTFFNFINVGILGNGNDVSYGAGATDGDGLQFTLCSHFKFSHCDISYHGGRGVYLVSQSWIFDFQNCRFIGNQSHGIDAVSTTEIQATAINFTDCAIWKNIGTGLRWCGVALTVKGGFIEANNIGIHFDSSYQKSNIAAASIYGVDFEQNKYEQIKITPSASTTVDVLNIEGCYFVNNYAGADKVASHIICDNVGLSMSKFNYSKNTYSIANGYGIMNLNSKVSFDCNIHVDSNVSTFLNLGKAKIQSISNYRSINGLLDQKGLPFTTPDISDDLLPVATPTGYWKLPINEFGYISYIDCNVSSDATTDFTIRFELFFQKSDGTIIASYTNNQTKTGGGSGKLTFGSIALSIHPKDNYIMYLKTSVVTKPSDGTFLKIKNVAINGSF